MTGPHVYVENAEIEACFQALRTEIAKHPEMPVAFLMAMLGKLCGNYLAVVPVAARDDLIEIWQTNAQMMVDDAERAEAILPPTSERMQ